jgi:hypothetical protein
MYKFFTLFFFIILGIKIPLFSEPIDQSLLGVWECKMIYPQIGIDVESHFLEFNGDGTGVYVRAMGGALQEKVFFMFSGNIIESIKRMGWLTYDVERKEYARFIQKDSILYVYFEESIWDTAVLAFNKVSSTTIPNIDGTWTWDGEYASIGKAHYIFKDGKYKHYWDDGFIEEGTFILTQISLILYKDGIDDKDHTEFWHWRKIDNDNIMLAFGGYGATWEGKYSRENN